MPTKIEWAKESWNPVTGCTPCSPGCDHCYAKRMAQGLKGQYGYPKDDPFRVTVHSGHVLQKPLHWKKPRRIFVCSMGDLFHEDVKEADQHRIFTITERAPQHTYICLTKRPQRQLDMGFYSLFKKNIWVGVTVCNQEEANKKIPILLRISAAVRWVSVEPMLEPIDISRYLDIGLNWVVCGGETGPRARPMKPKWAKSIRDQCVSASVPFFFKKHGDWFDKHRFPIDFPGDLGQLLDGKIWEEYPG